MLLFYFLPGIHYALSGIHYGISVIQFTILDIDYRSNILEIETLWVFKKLY